MSFGTTMTEDKGFKRLQMTLKSDHALPVQSCLVSMPVEPPWGRSYRLVEWTTPSERSSYRCVVPAESTEAEIARVVAAHVSGRRFVSESG